MGAAVLLLLAALNASAAPAPAPASGRVLEYESAQRLFGRLGPRLQPQAELFERWQYDGLRPQTSLMLGSYARALKHLKIGAFWRLQYGTRRDDDWVRSPQGRWSWLDTSRRPEHVLVLDATPRAELGFLPGRWVGNVKVRFERNYDDGRNVLLVEPELVYFWMDGLRPFATLFARHGTDFALNFGEEKVWRRWTYLAGLWHARPWLSLGPTLALRDEVWSTSPDYRRFSGGDSYRVLYRSYLVGGTLVARFR